MRVFPRVSWCFSWDSMVVLLEIKPKKMGIFMRNDFPVVGQTVCYGRYRWPMKIDEIEVFFDKKKWVCSQKGEWIWMLVTNRDRHGDMTSLWFPWWGLIEWLLRIAGWSLYFSVLTLCDSKKCNFFQEPTAPSVPFVASLRPSLTCGWWMGRSFS